jgi:hypothetical protein
VLVDPSYNLKNQRNTMTATFLCYLTFHLPFLDHFSTTWKVGYMMNCPGNKNEKIANYMNNLFFKLLFINLFTVEFLSDLVCKSEKF